jgi:hypothetical protein
MLSAASHWHKTMHFHPKTHPSTAGTRVTTSTHAQRRVSSTHCTAGAVFPRALAPPLRQMLLMNLSLKRFCWTKTSARRRANTASTWWVYWITHCPRHLYCTVLHCGVPCRYHTVPCCTVLWAVCAYVCVGEGGECCQPSWFDDATQPAAGLGLDKHVGQAPTCVGTCHCQHDNSPGW